MDLGIATFAAFSDGTLIPPLNALRTHEHKLVRAQQALARKVKFSQHWKKQQARITRLHTKFSCQQCGYSYHADVVAAQNILARGQRERLNAYALH